MSLVVVISFIAGARTAEQKGKNNMPSKLSAEDIAGAIFKHKDAEKYKVEGRGVITGHQQGQGLQDRGKALCDGLL